MKILVFEYGYTGHRLSYLKHLVPSLADLSDEVVLSTQKATIASVEYKTHLESVANRFAIDAWMPAITNSGLYRHHYKRFQLLKKSIKRIQPDYVYIPSADGLATAMGHFLARDRQTSRLAGMEGMLLRVPWAYKASSSSRRLKNAISHLGVKSYEWKALHLLDSLAYERLSPELNSWRASQISPMPDPIQQHVTYRTKEQARQELGLPEGGRYIGCVGGLNRRKGIDKLIRAFLQSSLRHNDRLLLVGPMEPALKAQFGPELTNNRIILDDRFVDHDHIAIALQAMDLVCTPYVTHMGSSSIVLRAAAANRPVLVNDTGWMREAVSRFGLGWVCDANHLSSLISAIERGLESAHTYKATEAARRFLEYNSPENFVAHWTLGIRKLLAKPESSKFIHWDWVTTQSPKFSGGLIR